MDWANDWAGFFGALLTNGGITPNGSVDTAQSSQLYNALWAVVLKSLPKRTFAQNDFIRIPDVPGGLIIQWGSQLSAGNSTVATYPTQFPNGVLRVVACGHSIERDKQAYVTVNSRTNSALSFSSFYGNPGSAPSSSSAGQVECHWYAIGF